MNRNANSKGTGTSRLVGFALTTALASAALTGCAGSAPPAAISAGKAEAALAQGQHSKAIDHAEAAVMGEPRNAAYRAVLGAAYLESGRFASAATSFQDAIDLGDASPRTALSLALALTAEGKQPQAVKLLGDWEGSIAAGDLGLAYSLAGAPERGIQVLTKALRGGENTAKVRQNLAYSYALAGHWKDARLMASEDIPADAVGKRMAQWAGEVHPDAYRERVALLLSVPAGEVDAGQPVQLALANFPTSDQLALETAHSPVPAPQAPAMARASSSSESLPVGDPVDSRVAAAPRAVATSSHDNTYRPNFEASAQASVPATVQTDSRRFISREVVQPLPAQASRSAPAATASRAVAPVSTRTASATPVSGGEGSHLVQLGSFSSEKGARRAWDIYRQRYPELANHDMVITKALVRGKEYYRVSAAGYDAGSSRAMCGRVNRASSDGCFAYAESSPMPGAVDTGRRFAMK